MGYGERSGRSVEVGRTETITKIQDVMLAEQILKARKIVQLIASSHGPVVSFLKD